MLPHQQCDRSLHHALGCRRACRVLFDTEKKAPSPSSVCVRESMCVFVYLEASKGAEGDLRKIFEVLHPCIPPVRICQLKESSPSAHVTG
jgi:hypothetical protein